MTPTERWNLQRERTKAGSIVTDDPIDNYILERLKTFDRFIVDKEGLSQLIRHTASELAEAIRELSSQ